MRLSIIIRLLIKIHISKHRSHRIKLHIREKSNIIYSQNAWILRITICQWERRWFKWFHATAWITFERKKNCLCLFTRTISFDWWQFQFVCACARASVWVNVCVCYIYFTISIQCVTMIENTVRIRNLKMK